MRGWCSVGRGASSCSGVVGVDISARRSSSRAEMFPTPRIHRAADVVELEFPDGVLRNGCGSLRAHRMCPVSSMLSCSPTSSDGWPRRALLLNAEALLTVLIGSADGRKKDDSLVAMARKPNRRMLGIAGLELLLDDVLVTLEPEGDANFWWVIRREPSKS